MAILAAMWSLGQVTGKDFNLWKETLKNDKTDVFKFYPTLSHLFIAGTGKPSPKDYETKGKMDEHFLKDLADFILKYIANSIYFVK